jgi:hypothetical protein
MRCAVHQPTWPLLLKIEHIVKWQVLGNNSKNINNIKNLTWGKNDQRIKIYTTYDGRRTDDGRTTDDDDGRQVMRIAHLTLWVR